MTTLTIARRAALNSLLLLWGALLLLTLLPSLAAAQSPTNGSTAAGLAPGSPAGSFALSGFESVSPYSGGLNFRLPLLKVGGRGGAAHTVTLPVEQKWRIVRWTDSAQQEHFLPEANWWSGYEPGYGPGVLQGRQAGDNVQQCAYVPNDSYYAWTLTRLTFTAPDGTEYDLRDTATGGRPANVPSPGPNCQVTNANRGKVFVTADGSAATFVSDADIYDASAVVNGGGDGLIYPSGHLMLRDGTRYRVDGGLVSWVRDRNGNLISFGYDTYGRVTTITDSLGRLTTVSYAVPGVPYDQISFDGFGGADRTIRVWYSSLGGALRTDRPGDSPSPKTYRELFPQLFDASPYTTYNPQVVSAVELPDGRRYEFRYNVYSELARVTLPTGGAFEYDYAAGVVGELSYNHMTGGMAEASSGVTGGSQVYRRVVTRRVYARETAAAEESRTIFSRPESYNAATKLYENAGHVTVDQTNAGGQLLARTRHYYHGSAHNSLFKGPLDYAGCTEGREYKSETYGPGGATVLRKVEQNWQPGVPLAANPGLCVNARIADVTATLADTNQVSKHVFAYDQYNNTTDLWEYDFGPGAPPAHALRHTRTDFLTLNDGLDYTSQNGPHIRDLVSAQRIYSVDPQTGAETLVSQSEKRYDESSYAPLAYGAVTGWQNPGTTARGMLTTARRWLDTSNIWVETHTQYDQLGNVRKVWDARGNLSELEYVDAFSDGVSRNTFSLATRTVSPVPDSTGQHGSATPLVVTSVYDFSTGLIVSATDANGKVTTVQYNDPLDRPTDVIRPPGAGETEFRYGDTPGNLYVRTLTDLDAARKMDSYKYFDGLGRPFRALIYENQDPAKPWITLDTEYDALGRVRRVSSPYRAAAGAPLFSTDRWTETVYDALGRTETVTSKPDNAVVANSYTGNQVTVTDQSGRQSLTVTDALERVTRVIEDPAQLAYVTDYKYDALGNLRRVDQGGQSRFFMFDSFGRLIRARVPEQAVKTSLALNDAVTGNSQWSLAYSYDPNGNLSSRTEARGVTTRYSYDALNRQTGATYENDPAGTPPSVTKYDFAVNGLGRAYLLAQSGTTAAATYIDEYDAAGRPRVQRQKFQANGVWGADFTVSRVYDLAGNVVSQTYPSGRSVSYGYDNAGRLASFAGNLGDSVQRNYSAGIVYDEQGGVRQEQFGTDTPLYNKRFYNSRGQLAEIRVSTYPVTSPGHETDWNRGAILNTYSQLAGWTESREDNNGTLRKQMVFIPHDDGLAAHTLLVQYYGYDRLGRLGSVEDKLNNAVINFRQTYVYDRWGNRTIDAALTTNAPAPQFAVDAATNRLGVPAGHTGRMDYDAAGNLVNDSYTGYGSHDGTPTRSFDAEGRMTSAADYYGQTSSYVYDAAGRRVRRRVANTPEVWQIYGMDGELLAEYAASASPSQPRKEYGYRGGELLITADAPAPAPKLPVSAVMASLAWGSFTPEKGADGNPSTSWVAGGGAPQWLQLDLGQASAISKVRLLVNQDPPGNTTHQVWGGPSPDSLTLLGTLSGHTQSGQWLELAAQAQGARYVRVVTTSSPSWVAWSEVEVYGEAAPQPPSGGLAAHWKLDEGAGTTAADSSSSGYTATLSGPSWAAGKVGASALSFDGVDDRLTTSSPSGVANNFTISFWANPDAAHEVDPEMTYSTYGASGQRYAWWPMWRPGGDAGAGVSVGTNGVSVYEHGPNFVAPMLVHQGPVSGWTHVAVVYENKQPKLYINGALVRTGLQSPRDAVWAVPQDVGGNVYGYYDGSLDDVRLYNRSLSASEVSQLTGAGGATAAAATSVRWIVSDHLGTPRMVLDKTGSLAGVKRHDYLPFGDEAPVGWGGRTPERGYVADDTRQNFTGYERDAETGLHYARARYYASGLGRFISPDPLSSSGKTTAPQSWNRYAYCLNSPLTFSDPSGLIWIYHDNGNGTWNLRWVSANTVPPSMQKRGWRAYTGPTRLQLAGRNGFAELRHGYAEVWIGPSMQMNVRGQGNVNMAAGAIDSVPGMNWVRIRTGMLTYADESSGEYKNTQIIATGVGAAKAVKGLAALGTAAYKGIRALADDAGRAADDAVTLFHGSTKNADEILDSGLDVNRSGATYVSPDMTAAKDAIDARRALGEATNPGIVTSRVPRSEIEALINSGDIGVRPYHGFYPYKLNTVEYLLHTPASKELFNKGIQR